MSWMDTISDLAQRYSSPSGGPSAAAADAHQDYQQAVQHAPPEAVSSGLSEAFRSDRTEPFPQMVSNLFAHSDPNQRAGLLNRLLGGMGPSAAVAGLLGGGGQISPQQASQIPPEQVQQLAAHAEKQNPSVVDQVSSFYAQHPQVVKALGGLALTIALQHMMRRN